jgi:hypothetical protein
MAIIAKYGHISPILPDVGQIFSAVKTGWRRELDSNPRCRFETRKSRRVRNLHQIKELTRESTSAGCHPTDTNQPGYKSLAPGEQQAIVWLKVVGAKGASRPIGKAHDCLPSGKSVKSKKNLPERASEIKNSDEGSAMCVLLSTSFGNWHPVSFSSP